MNTFNNLAVALDFVVGDEVCVSYNAAFAALSSFSYGDYNSQGEWEDYSYSEQEIKNYLDYMKM
jgi:hypothetical protein